MIPMGFGFPFALVVMAGLLVAHVVLGFWGRR